MPPLTQAQKAELCKFAYCQGAPFPNNRTSEQIDALGDLMGYPRPSGMEDDNYIPLLAEYIVGQHSIGVGRFA